MAREKELVLRGSFDPNCAFIKGNKANILIQYETHNHLPDGMITNRCRKTKYPDGREVCSTATKYVYSRTATGKEAEEIESEIDDRAFTTIASMLNEGVVKARYTIERETYAIEIDVFLDFSTHKWTDGFKIDVEGDSPPSQDELQEQLANAGFIVTEWLDPKAWGARYNQQTRKRRNNEVAA